ncbi:MAG: hypothetical protein WC513_09780, partial [Bacteroidales bacterium]
MDDKAFSQKAIVLLQRLPEIQLLTTAYEFAEQYALGIYHITGDSTQKSQVNILKELPQRTQLDELGGERFSWQVQQLGAKCDSGAQTITLDTEELIHLSDLAQENKTMTIVLPLSSLTDEFYQKVTVILRSQIRFDGYQYYYWKEIMDAVHLYYHPEGKYEDFQNYRREENAAASARTRPGKKTPTAAQVEDTLRQIHEQGAGMVRLSQGAITKAAAELRRQKENLAAELLERLYAANRIHAPPVTGAFENVFGLVYFEEGIIDEAHLRIFISQDVADETHPENLTTLIHEAIEAHSRMQGLNPEDAHKRAEKAEEDLSTDEAWLRQLVMQADTDILALIAGTKPTVWGSIDDEAERKINSWHINIGSEERVLFNKIATPLYILQHRTFLEERGFVVEGDGEALVRSILKDWGERWQALVNSKEASEYFTYLIQYEDPEGILWGGNVKSMWFRLRGHSDAEISAETEYLIAAEELLIGYPESIAIERARQGGGPELIKTFSEYQRGLEAARAILAEDCDVFKAIEYFRNRLLTEAEKDL